MEYSFNVLDKPWILARRDNCQIDELNLKDALLNAHNYVELAGETKTQDFAVLRLMLAVIYTIFSRYDTEGNETEEKSFEIWKKIWSMKQFPKKPIETYFNKWYDRFELFDDKYPFYQSIAVNEKTKPVSTAKLIGSLFESNNKSRLFSDRAFDGRNLSFSEVTRWLIHITGFDDIAAKPTPKKAWNSKLGLIAVKGKNLFETLMLNFVADKDEQGTPVWEREIPYATVNHLVEIPHTQADLLTFPSRQVYLKRDDNMITGYYIAGGDYFEEEDVYIENMTIWQSEKKTKNSLPKFKPKKHDATKKVWQEFGAIAAFPDLKENDEYTPGVIKWIQKLCKKKNGKDRILDRNDITILTAAVIYDTGQSMSLPVIDYISDSVTFHSQLLLDSGKIWRDVINEEIANCEKAAKKVYTLCVNLQEVSGASGDRITGSDAKVQFYDRIDRAFRLWLEELDAESDKYKDYADMLEDKIFKIARDLGYELVGQTSANAIFGRYKKPENNENTSSAQALNRYISSIKKIFNKAGDKK